MFQKLFFSPQLFIMNEIFCQIDIKGALCGYTILFLIFINLWHKMAYRGKQLFFNNNWFPHLFIM